MSIQKEKEFIKKKKNECKYLTNKSNMFCQIIKVLNLWNGWKIINVCLIDFEFCFSKKKMNSIEKIILKDILKITIY